MCAFIVKRYSLTHCERCETRIIKQRAKIRVICSIMRRYASLGALPATSYEPKVLGSVSHPIAEQMVDLLLLLEEYRKEAPFAYFCANMLQEDLDKLQVTYLLTLLKGCSTVAEMRSRGIRPRKRKELQQWLAYRLALYQPQMMSSYFAKE